MSEIEKIQISRICVSLQTEDKKRRKNGLAELDKLAFADEQKFDSKNAIAIWESVHQNLARLLSDPVEACRESCIELLKKFLTVLPPHEGNLRYVIPIMAQRLGPQELIEPSEEVRLNLILLLRIIVEKCRDCLLVYLDDVITILKRSVTDNYHSVKKESCSCISEVAKAVPAHFYHRSESLVKPIITNLTHQHYRVRETAVDAIGNVLQYGDNKSIQDVATPLAERLFDQSSAVRMADIVLEFYNETLFFLGSQAVVRTAGRWLLELRDRYSWWHKLIPLLLTGLHDEIESIRNEAGRLWQMVGEKYISENDTDEKFKDKLDYLSDVLEHYPPNIMRPNLGCRTIAQQNLCKLIGAIASELGDWMADIRVRSAQLLCVLVLNVEQDITQNITQILPAMYRACNDEDSRVVDNVELAAEYMGYFVPSDIYCHLVLPTLEENPTSGHLRVLAAILRGSDRKNLLSKLEQIVEFLKRDDICHGKKTDYQEQILRCCEALTSVSKDDCRGISQDLFTVMFTILSLTVDEKIQQQAKDLLLTLVDIEQLKDLEELYNCHLRLVLKHASAMPEAWTIYTPEFLILQACLIHSGSVASQHLDLILPMLQRAMNKDGDPQIRLKLFIQLSNYLQRRNETLKNAENLPHFIGILLKDIITPSLTWSAGRTAEAVRTAAICCLCAALDTDNSSHSTAIVNESETCSNNDHDSEETTRRVSNIRIQVQQEVQLFPDSESFLQLFEEIIPILIGLVDDNVRKTRLYALRAICQIVLIGKNLSCINEEHIHRIYPVVLKRLDDGCDEVRFFAMKTLAMVWSAAPENYDIAFSRSHVDALYTTTIVHLDDPEPKFQEAVLDTMKELIKVHPELLVQKLENCRSNFRNQAGIEALLKRGQELLSEKSSREEQERRRRSS